MKFSSENGIKYVILEVMFLEMNFVMYKFKFNLILILTEREIKK